MAVWLTGYPFFFYKIIPKVKKTLYFWKETPYNRVTTFLKGTKAMNNQNLLANIKRIHFIGIGGSGMSPLAEILHAK